MLHYVLMVCLLSFIYACSNPAASNKPNTPTDSLTNVDTPKTTTAPIDSSSKETALPNHDYFLPKGIFVDEAPSTQFCSNDFGCLSETIYPIGWSANQQYFAYTVELVNEAIGGFGGKVVVQDLSTNKIAWEWVYQQHEDENWNEDEYIDMAGFWKKNASKITAKFSEYNIVQAKTDLSVQAFPLTLPQQTIHPKLSNKTRINPHLEIEEIGQQDITLEINQKQNKTILSTVYGEWDVVLNTVIFGAFVSPDQKSLVLLNIREKRGWEGPPNVLEFQLAGANL